MKELFEYQKKIVDSQKLPSTALFMEPGTGKTVTSLALFKKSGKSKLLVLCIVSKLQDWQDDILSECNMNSIILDKGSTKNHEILLKRESDCYIINFESAWRVKELLNWVDNDTYIIVDESHKIKSVSSKIGKFADKLRLKTDSKCILTGTPQAKGYIDYYNQLSFIDVFKFPFKIFRDTYCEYTTQNFNGYPFKQLTGYKNTYQLDKIINDNCVFFKRDIDNDQIPTEVDIKFNKPKKYDYFKKIRIYEDYVADNSSKLFVTMRKMCSGNIDKYEIDSQKLDWLEDFLEDSNFRVVLFYNFNFEKDRIIKLLDKMNIPHSQFNGAVKDLTNFNKFSNAVVLCQYQSASLGLNDLVKSNICVLFSPTLNYTDFVQSKKRIDRIGQTKKPLFYNLYCKGTVEEKILQTIKKGQNFDEKMFESYLKEER